MTAVTSTKTLIMMLLLSMLAVGAEASSFTPDRFSVTVLDSPLVVSNGSATVTLQGNPEWGWGPQSHEAPAAIGTWLAKDPCIGSFTVDIMLSLWASTAPNEVSVTRGQLTGTYGSDAFGFIHGNINSAPLYAVSMAYPYEPGVPTSFVVLIDKPRDAVLTTVPEAVPVPEPSTILMVGAGLARLLKGALA